MVANIVKTFTPLHPPGKLLRALGPKSTVLFEITEGFVHKTQNLQLVSFYELNMTSIGIFKKLARPSTLVPDAVFSNLTRSLQVVEHHSAVLNLPNEVAITQYADHREIARFESLHDRNFRSLLTRINIFKEDILGKVKSIACGQPEVSTGGICAQVILIPSHKEILTLRAQVTQRSSRFRFCHATHSMEGKTSFVVWRIISTIRPHEALNNLDTQFVVSV